VDDLQSEKEQLDEMRAWWSEYGKVIILGIVIAVGGLIGWNSHKDSKLEAQVEASELFETLALHVTGGKLDDAESVADDLVTNYANTTYAAQSRLAMARLYMDQNRDQDAADTLNELLAMDANDELKNIARVRLAHVLLYQDKAQEVVDLLDGVSVGAFNSLYDEQRGDAFTALGQYENAGDAYRRALADPSPNPVVDRGLVQMKLIDLPATVVAEAAETAEATEDEVAEEAAEEVAAEDGEAE
jgi:predicted negative regulator of RcsB-dependent stress response